MKKTSLYLDDDVDRALARRAAAQGISKAELIRQALSDVAGTAPAARITGIGGVRGLPSDMSHNVDRYLSESRFGEA